MDFDILSKAMQFEKVVGEILFIDYNIKPVVTNRDLKFDYQTFTKLELR